MPNSYYLDNIINDYKYGNQAIVSIPTRYLGLFTTMPTPAGGQVEVSGGSYARVTVTNNLTNFPASALGSKRNATAFTFPAPTADWGIVLGAGWFDAISGGNLLDYGLFGTPISILNGDPAFVIAISGGLFKVQ